MIQSAIGAGNPYMELATVDVAKAASVATNIVDKRVRALPVVDSTISSTSTNAVQNKVVKGYVDNSVIKYLKDYFTIVHNNKLVATAEGGTITSNAAENSYNADGTYGWLKGFVEITPSVDSWINISMQTNFRPIERLNILVFYQTHTGQLSWQRAGLEVGGQLNLRILNSWVDNKEFKLIFNEPAFFVAPPFSK